MDLAKALVKAAELLYKAIKTANANTKQLTRLEERVRVIVDTVQPKLAPAHEKAVTALQVCLEEATDIIKRIGHRSNSFERMIHANSDKQQIEAINIRLNQSSQDLSLYLGIQASLNLGALFNKQQTKEDEAADFAVLQAIAENGQAMQAQFQLVLQCIEAQNAHLQHIDEVIVLHHLKATHAPSLVLSDPLQASVSRFLDTAIAASKTKPRVGPTKAPSSSSKSALGLLVPEVPFTDLLFLQKLGSGSYADVFLGEWISKCVRVAIKRLHVSNFSAKTESDFLEEVNIMSGLSHEYTVALLGVCLEPDRYCLILEYAPGGSVADYISAKRQEDFPWPKRIQMATDMAQCIHYLHEMTKRTILHQDIKPANFLLCKREALKVSDFGMSVARLESASRTQGVHRGGTAAYEAPEALAGQL